MLVITRLAVQLMLAPALAGAFSMPLSSSVMEPCRNPLVSRGAALPSVLRRPAGGGLVSLRASGKPPPPPDEGDAPSRAALSKAERADLNIQLLEAGKPV
jgi:hypothetical protein